MGKVCLGNVIFDSITSNDYLNELFSKIMENYSKKTFHLNSPQSDFSLSDALRFADLLSKSTSEQYSEKHKLLSQEMIALLNTLYPDNETIKYFMGSILTSVGNLPGVKLRVPKYKNDNTLQRLFDEFSFDYYTIPASPDTEFFSTQKDIYEHLGDKCFSYSGPTSMGKSFVVRMFIKQEVFSNAKRNFALIVPTKALINEVSSEIINDLKNLLEEKNYRVVTSANSISVGQKHHFIYVMTPERMLFLLLEHPDAQIDFMFIDEAQKISTKDNRSAFYYKVVQMLKEKGKTNIIFASPNIPNPDVYLKLLNSDDSGKSKATYLSPVSQIKFLVDLESHTVQTYNSLKNDFLPPLQISDSTNLFSLIRTICHSPNEEEKQSIVYCSSKNKAVRYAIDFSESLPLLNNPKLDAFSDQICKEINPEYYLVDLVKKGIAYHIGYLPSTIRSKLEVLFKEGLIRTVFCTSTLVEGVNLPADNLFITNYKNGNSNMTGVEFKNLIGRVGRIKYNLYGNVFLVVEKEAKPKTEEKYKELVTKESEKQKLSIDECLTKPIKEKIVSSLLKGSTSLAKEDFGKKCTEEEYELIRKFSIILLDDIVKNRDSLVVKRFEQDGLLTEESSTKLRMLFDKSFQNIGNDINVSLDQTESLSEAIISGMKYPEFNEELGRFDYNDALGFLERMGRIFRWQQYERQLTGNNGFTKLRYYATILLQWMSGKGLLQITNAALDYKNNNPGATVIENGQSVIYDGSKKHKNIAIAETLEVIDNVILFSFSNYFLRFSAEYKKIFGEDSLEGKDWYEFVEFGSTNRLSIFLQRNGYSRDSAIYLMRHRQKYIITDGQGFKISNLVFQSENEGIVSESKDIIYNIKSLFN
jgi:hypothetical protein